MYVYISIWAYLYIDGKKWLAVDLRESSSETFDDVVGHQIEGAMATQQLHLWDKKSCVHYAYGMPRW